LRREAAFVLVVGDDAIMRRCLARVVRRLGYCAREAGSPLAAQRAAIESRRIDLLLTDLSMPETNGPKLARWFRIASPETRVLITTGSLWELQCDAGELEQFALLAKPFTTAELAHMVRLLLRQADSAPHRQARKSDRRTRRVELR
jgi:DNA-binding NtrC family response regulator